MLVEFGGGYVFLCEFSDRTSIQLWELFGIDIPFVMQQLEMVGSIMSQNDDSQQANHVQEVNDI